MGCSAVFAQQQAESSFIWAILGDAAVHPLLDDHMLHLRAPTLPVSHPRSGAIEAERTAALPTLCTINVELHTKQQADSRKGTQAPLVFFRLLHGHERQGDQAGRPSFAKLLALPSASQLQNEQGGCNQQRKALGERACSVPRHRDKLHGTATKKGAHTARERWCGAPRSEGAAGVPL